MDGIKTIPPISCDTFAVLSAGTKDECIIFGKNSDRPDDEVQEIVRVPATDYPLSSKVKCTYIEIEQVAHTYAVVLSKPAWMWGAEMGANEFGVCIGNEAVWTKLQDSSDSEEKLIGMDLLRLGLERSKSAPEAIKVITSLIAEYGMGGNCSETLDDFTYHNSFLIADPSEVWILECAGNIWVAQNVKSTVRNISNELTIRTDFDLSSDGLEKFAEEKKLWNPKRGPLDFKKTFDVDDFDSSRYNAGKRLLTNLSKNGMFTALDMFSVLRDKPSGICMSDGSFVSTSSQVSVLYKPDTGKPCCHWFTGTPDPSRSVFKPFIFTANVIFPDAVVSPEHRFPLPINIQVSDRKHNLYRLHEKCLIKHKKNSASLKKQQADLEEKYLNVANEIETNTICSASNLFELVVKEEILLYSEGV